MEAWAASLQDGKAETPEEFGAVSKAYQEYREAEYRGQWERMRLLATITIQPHVKKKMTPQALLPFEWDRQKPKAEFVRYAKRANDGSIRGPAIKI